MSSRIFIDCLNQEPKAYNCSIASLICGGIMLVFFGAIKGLFWAAGAGAAGFIVGAFLGKEWFAGNLQRNIFWHLPFASIWLENKAPPSSARTEL